MKFAVCASLVLLGSAVASAESLEAFLKSFGGKVDAALMKKDLKAFETTLRANTTKDFVYIEDGRKMDFDGMLKSMQMGFGTMDKMLKVSSKTLSMKTTDDTGMVVTAHHMENTMKAQPGQKPALSVYTGKSTDEYRKVNGQWKLAKMTWYDTKMTINGKPFNMSGPPPKG